MNAKLSISQGKPVTGKYCSKLNIADLLSEASETHKDKGILFIQNNNAEVFMTYEQIFEQALYCLGKLQESGLKEQDLAILSLVNNIDFVVSFWACIFGGIIPAPISPPSSFKGKNVLLEKLINVWHTLEKPVIISDDAVIKTIESNDLYPEGKNMVKLDAAILRQSSIKGSIKPAPAEKPALIQFSSGSTSTPKGVILTHKNLLTNIEGIIEGAGLTSEDRILSWMPYYHDMGLIGNHLTLTALGIFQINMHPVKFVKRPALWFDLISRHKITVTSSPNFGYRLVLRKIKDKHLEAWDLSSLRIIFNGAEPISVPLVREFMKKFAKCKLAETSMFMVYGMAEACLAVTFPTPGIIPESHCLSRKSLIQNSRAEEVKESDPDSFPVANEGYPVPGMEVRIVDEQGKIVFEKELGEIQIKGDNVTSGYINNPEATVKSFQDGWLKTGDTGFMIDGKLCVTGRLKDIIFVNGQNFFAHDIEFELEEFAGVEPGKVVVCGWHDEQEGREKVALFSALRIDEENVTNFYANILSNINETFGITVDYVVIIRSIPKTSSGKVQRFMLVQRFLNNEYADKVLTSDELLFNLEKRPEEGRQQAAQIREIWAKVLDKPAPSIGYNQPFLSLGGTSLKAVEVLSMLEDVFNLTLSHDLLVNCKTINDMDEYLSRLFQANTSKNNVPKTAPLLPEPGEDIAVIEMACRFPDASSPEEFWQNLVSGKCSIREIPEDRWDIDQYYSPHAEPTKTNCRSGAFIANPFDFAAGFFNISDQEAAVMDPQQRIILELAFELLEKAGYPKPRISGRPVGLFMGAGTNSYYEYHLNTLNLANLKSFASFTSLSKEQQEAMLKEWQNKMGVTAFHPNLLVDNILNMIAARTSQEFNLRGPSIVVDTACSSSLVTLHLACESLRRGECELAIAGGINLLLTPTPYIYLSNAGALSPSGTARVFDARTDGLVPGEGAGLVLLKPLSQALADQDEVLAVIKASSINNDGRSIGVMAPNPDGQREVIESLYLKNGLSPRDIQYVEAHGTGTNIGDLSEVRALDSAFKRWDPAANTIALGSVKANIGHLLSAAGIASFIKVVLALKHKVMPPNVNLNELNPSIKFAKTPFYTFPQAKDWQVDPGTVRRASVNSYGFGGTNCHMVIEEAPESVTATPAEQYERARNALCAGININWDKFEEGISYTKQPLPLYPWQRKTYKPDFGGETIQVPNNWFYNWDWKIESDPPADSFPPGDKMAIAPEKKSSLTKVKTANLMSAKNIRETVYQGIVDQLSINPQDLEGSRNFVELGLDSLGAVKVMEKLGQNLGIELYPTLIFEYQTPDSLAQYIEKTYSGGYADQASPKIDLEERTASALEQGKEIAIIGAGLRIPGAGTLEEYWDILQNGRCVIREVPADRWSINDYFDPDPDSMATAYAQFGGFIDQPYEFDPLFFGLSPSEAAVIDPQQRIFLEVAWETLQLAGYGGKYGSHSIGVFVGCEQNNYAEHFTNYRTFMELKNLLLKHQIFKRISDQEQKELLTSIGHVLKPAKMVPDAVAGNSLNEVAARVSHCLDITGPSLTINSACSSSLAALHLACESIRTGQCQMAIAGGVNLNLSPTPFIGLSRVAALSNTGTCYPFDSRANGMVLSEGASAVLLKPLEAARRDRDNILAVIKGSAINNDGHSRGLTAPRPGGQAEVIRKAYLEAGINPETIAYIETHGAGTPLGDPIEIEGMTRAFRSFTTQRGFCAIGSVKSSLGHMLAASGITSLIKVVLAFKHKTIPHTLNYDKLTPNPNIDFANSPFYVAAEKPREWENGPDPLRAGVNAFGFGGTNVHVILEEAPGGREEEYAEENPPYLLQLTGRTEKVIRQIAANLNNYLQQHPRISASSICFTLYNAQKELSAKTSALVKSRNHLQEILTSLENGGSSEDVYQGRSNPNRETEAYLLLDGNLNLAEKYKDDLGLRFSVFKTAYQECWDRYAMLENLNHPADERVESLAVQYALGVLLSSFNLKIHGLVAQGTGIAAAAVLAGLINIDQALEKLLALSPARTGDSENNKGVFLNCPVITPAGVAGESPDLDLQAEGDIQALNGLAGKKQVIIYPGEINKIKPQKVYDDQLFTWVEMNISEKPAESLIRAFARLYTLGVRYNPNQFLAGKEKRVALPTYPFENQTYKVSFPEDI